MSVDPFAEALCCFEPLNRPVTEATVNRRQLQVLTLVAQGKTTAAIAAEIGPNQRTVERTDCA
jgi:DNA-binding NarL/FixJ family response regulator